MGFLRFVGFGASFRVCSGVGGLEFAALGFGAWGPMLLRVSSLFGDPKRDLNAY